MKKERYDGEHRTPENAVLKAHAPKSQRKNGTSGVQTLSPTKKKN
jgi:hypothetical protein